MTGTLVFDNTPLSHFARAGRLAELEVLVAGYRCVTPEEVSKELIAGVPHHPALARAISTSWLEIVELTETTEIAAFARYKQEFGGRMTRNNGEAAVLAWTSANGGIAVIDERAATRAAQRDGLDCHGTLWLVANGVRDGKLERGDAERIVDELALTDMALPVDGEGFMAWAYQEGMFPGLDG